MSAIIPVILISLLVPALGLFVAGVCSEGKRALFFGLSGFSLVAMPLGAVGIHYITRPVSSPEMPFMSSVFGGIGIVIAVVGGLILGSIFADIGAMVDRR